MKVIDLLYRYARYNQWAHQSLLDIIGKLSKQQQQATIPSSFNSLYKTLFHVWGAEHLWFLRLNREPVPKMSGDPFNGSMEDLTKALTITDLQWIEWIADKSDNDLTLPVQYTNTAGQSFEQPYDILLHHIFNHSTYHNGQLVSMLRALGINQIPSTDFVTWTRLENA